MNSLGCQTAAPDLSIVLVNWNTCDLTSAALESIERHTRGLLYEVIVVDNGTTRDDSVRELPRRFPSIRLISNPRNLGFSVSSNQGIAMASGRYVLLLNSDTIQTEDALSAAVRYMAHIPTWERRHRASKRRRHAVEAAVGVQVSAPVAGCGHPALPAVSALERCVVVG
jgi:glycosyltransferase involved in cell wall biosynthesis